MGERIVPGDKAENCLEMIVHCPQCQATIWALSCCNENVFNLYVFSSAFLTGLRKTSLVTIWRMENIIVPSMVAVVIIQARDGES